VSQMALESRATGSAGEFDVLEAGRDRLFGLGL